MRAHALISVLASGVLAACATNVDYGNYQLTVVDAETFQPLPNVNVVVDYGFGEVISPPPQVQARTGQDGQVTVEIAEWGHTFVQAGGTRYFVTSCGTAPRGWVHPDGAEYLETMPDVDPAYLFEVEHVAASFRNNVGRVMPAGTPGIPLAAVHIRPLGSPDSAWQRSTGRCSFTPLFPAP